MNAQQWAEFFQSNQDLSVLHLRSGQIRDLADALTAAITQHDDDKCQSPQLVVTLGTCGVVEVDADLYDRLPKLGDGTVPVAEQDVYDQHGNAHTIYSLGRDFAHVRGREERIALASLTSTQPAPPSQPTIEDRLAALESLVEKLKPLPGISGYGMFD